MYFWKVNEDTFITIAETSTSKYVDRKSVFYAFAIPVDNEDIVDEHLKKLRKKYYDARHICYAFCLNADKSISRSSDNGEPSGTAGRPMMGVIQSHNLTNILLVAVRYFGGIKLGTSGLIEAYRTVSELAISQARIITKTEDATYTFKFDYAQMNKVMSTVKAYKLKVLESSFDMVCYIKVSGPKSAIAELQTLIADAKE